MTEATQTLAQLKKTSKLTRLAFHKNGPKSFRRGQGALLNALLENDGATQRELVHILGFDRGELKGVVKKAERNGYVTIEDAEGVRTYARQADRGRPRGRRKACGRQRQDGRGHRGMPVQGGDGPAERHHREAHPVHEGQGHQRKEEGPQGSWPLLRLLAAVR